MNDAVTVRLIAGGLGCGLVFSLGGIAIIGAFGHDGQLASNALTAFITIAGACVGSLGGILINPKGSSNGVIRENPAAVVVTAPVRTVDTARS